MLKGVRQRITQKYCGFRKASCDPWDVALQMSQKGRQLNKEMGTKEGRLDFRICLILFGAAVTSYYRLSGL